MEKLNKAVESVARATMLGMEQTQRELLQSGAPDTWRINMIVALQRDKVSLMRCIAKLHDGTLEAATQCLKMTQKAESYINAIMVDMATWDVDDVTE